MSAPLHGAGAPQFDLRATRTALKPVEGAAAKRPHAVVQLSAPLAWLATSRPPGPCQRQSGVGVAARTLALAAIVHSDGSLVVQQARRGTEKVGVVGVRAHHHMVMLPVASNAAVLAAPRDAPRRAALSVLAARRDAPRRAALSVLAAHRDAPRRERVRAVCAVATMLASPRDALEAARAAAPRC
eukprot:102535-Chlamydomonas_euryale.AAC.1